ncbi:MAG: signal recognition particle-docking protein FtsY [Deltaproteobacteria bacterium]|nr:signal recognition particle-docking protein FtsY [Deltaproteobacteria bacterium]
MVKWFKFRKDKTSESAIEPGMDEVPDEESGDLPAAELPAVAEPPADSESDDITDRDGQTARQADPPQADPPEEGPGSVQDTAEDFDEDLEPQDKAGFFGRLKTRLAKTRQGFAARVDRLLSGGAPIDDDLIENLEEIMIVSDVGVNTTHEIIESLQRKVTRKEVKDSDELKKHLRETMVAFLQTQTKPLELTQKPTVIMVVGVNGVGKTTTIGKLASRFTLIGRKVMLVAGDTFRAAAIEQLDIWGERVDAEVVKQKPGSDPSAVVFDALEAARKRDVDLVIIDTAGRLHTKVNLMEELKKIHRTIAGRIPGAPHETFLVLDATTGQNAISQAVLFKEAVDITGIVITKLDGTAKGGIIVGISHELQVPIRYIGIGEKVTDLREFEAEEFIAALF